MKNTSLNKKNQDVFKINRFSIYTNSLESKTASIANLADEIWREHFPSIIGDSQTDYMLKKFQSAEQICIDIKTNGFVYFTAECLKSKELAGYCACQPKEDYLLLSKMYVRKVFRGTGVSRIFLVEAAALCQQRGLNKIRLTVNKYNSSAIMAYQKMGFETIDSVKVDIGGGFFMDDFIMELHPEMNN